MPEPEEFYFGIDFRTAPNLKTLNVNLSGSAFYINEAANIDFDYDVGEDSHWTMAYSKLQNVDIGLAKYNNQLELPPTIKNCIFHLCPDPLYFADGEFNPNIVSFFGIENLKTFAVQVLRPEDRFLFPKFEYWRFKQDGDRECLHSPDDIERNDISDLMASDDCVDIQRLPEIDFENVADRNGERTTTASRGPGSAVFFWSHKKPDTWQVHKGNHMKFQKLAEGRWIKKCINGLFMSGYEKDTGSEFDSSGSESEVEEDDDDQTDPLDNPVVQQLLDGLGMTLE